MTKARRILASFVVTLAIAAAAAGSLALSSTPAQAKCGICPLYCIGVLCDDGHVYCNSCLAGCAGAHHCHPIG